ncbi:MAG TPA: DUF4838 domain-containing protein [Lentisphaeria bacterium]|nr:DUF4838 domain-containing protein [Lentisphaeria bacterium]
MSNRSKVLFHRILLLTALAWLTSALPLSAEHWRQPSEAATLRSLGITAVSPEAQAAAMRLADILRRIYPDAAFPLASEGDGQTGIAVGTVQDFPALAAALNITIAGGDPAADQGYEIKTYPQGIAVLAATVRGLDFAVADLLHALGYRWFFPMPKWEVLPAEPPATLGVHIRETPDYISRRIWPGWGLWPYMRGQDQDTPRWEKLNRKGGFDLRTGHAYERFVQQHQSQLQEHPEYLALVKGERKGNKLCTANPGLQKLFCDWIVAGFTGNPNLDSASADPSDGGNWCECEACARLGEPSDRALFLANRAAEAVRQAGFTSKRIGIYAYNLHSPPPAGTADRDVVVSIATMFIKGGWKVEDLIDGWQARQATIGMREYYYGNTRPASGWGGDLNYITSTIPDFYRRGARYMTSESTDAWGNAGMPRYVASRLLWNISEDPAAIINDFLARAFPRSQAEIRSYFKLMNGPNRPILSDDLLGRLYRCLAAALTLADGSPAEQARLYDLAAYVRAAELTHALDNAPTLENYLALMNYAAASRDRRMVHAYSMSRDNRPFLPAALRGQTIPDIDWKTDKLITDAEIDGFIQAGIKNFALLPFTPIAFSSDLKLAPLAIAPQRGEIGPGRHIRHFHLWSDGQPFKLGVTGGLIAHYRDRGNVKISLTQIGGPSETGELETVVYHDASTPPDGQPYTLSVIPRHAGLHRLEVSDGSDSTLLEWPEGLPVAILVDRDNYPATNGTLFFYIPANAETLGFYAKTQRGLLQAPDGRTLLNLQNHNGHGMIPMPEDCRGNVLTLKNFSGIFRPLTVPPVLSLYAHLLLLPN